MENLIQVKNLTKKYHCKNRQELFVLDHMNLEINRGEFFCIVGESGCGKSTLLRLMSGLDTDYKGEVTINNERIRGPKKTRGFVYQENRLFPWMTVEKNVSFVLNKETRTVKQEKAREMLKLVGLAGFENAYPKELSGGMRQRVNIARALVNEPEILFLDEPFGALDAFTRMKLQSELLKIKEIQKNTMVLVTHDIEEAVYLADRIAVLGRRPAKVVDIVEIDLAKPRNRNTSEFLRSRKIIYSFFTENNSGE